jgi:polysaccharide export outer membrane protein
MLKRVVFVLLTAGWLMGGGQSPLPVEPAQPQDASQYVLGPDDQIKIWALGMEEISDKPVRIGPGGYIDIPLIGRVHAEGLTSEQLKAELVKQFAREVRKPEVSVEITEFGSQPVSVMGAVNTPGVHQLRGRKTLAEVLSLAGGLRQDAGPRVKISREIRFGPIPLSSAKIDSSNKFSVAEVDVRELIAAANPADNILISPHDVITVPAAEKIYVIGQVRKPGTVVLDEHVSISVLQALSMAEGLGQTPAPQNSKILRMVPGSTGRQQIPVDLRKILAGKAEDLAMRPNDILVVPESGPKKAASRAVEAAIQTATGIVIWHRP